VSKRALRQCVPRPAAKVRQPLAAKVRLFMHQLGISLRYGAQHQLALQHEAPTLQLCGLDLYGRELWLAPAAREAWQRMRAAAHADGITLHAVSGFRSVEYQAKLLQNKLRRGQRIEDILRVSAAPGYSEHHSGRALDISDCRENALETQFEHSAAYQWLLQYAGRFGFQQSFPRDNPHGISFEPWHWCHHRS
jgi:zinc D-Ala-D-Ala carboxypeptidase